MFSGTSRSPPTQLGSRRETHFNSRSLNPACPRKVLPPYIRVIQGDGISYESLKEILANIEATWQQWRAMRLVASTYFGRACVLC